MLSITFDECATALLPYVLPGLLYNKNVDWPKLEQASIYFVDKILQTFGTIVHQTKTLLTKEILSILIHSKFAKLDVELVSKESNHLSAILHVYAGGLNFMKYFFLVLFFKKKTEILLHFLSFL